MSPLREKKRLSRIFWFAILRKKESFQRLTSSYRYITTAQNTEISGKFLVWRFCGNTHFRPVSLSLGKICHTVWENIANGMEDCFVRDYYINRNCWEFESLERCLQFHRLTHIWGYLTWKSMVVLICDMNHPKSQANRQAKPNEDTNKNILHRYS